MNPKDATSVVLAFALVGVAAKEMTQGKAPDNSLLKVATYTATALSTGATGVAGDGTNYIGRTVAGKDIRVPPAIRKAAIEQST